MAMTRFTMMVCCILLKMSVYSQRVNKWNFIISNHFTDCLTPTKNQLEFASKHNWRFCFLSRAPFCEKKKGATYALKAALFI